MPNNKLEYLTATTIEELQSHAMQWDSLLNRSVQRSPMLSHAWISNHLTHFLRPEQSWTCVFAYSGKHLVAVMPLIFSPRSWPISHIIAKSPFGSHLNIGDILHDEDLSNLVLPGILNFTFATYSSITSIELPRVSSESATMSTSSKESGSLAVSVSKRSFGDYLPPQGDFDAYEKSLRRNFRKNLNKAKNKLAKLDDVEFEFLRTDFDVADCLKRFCNMERSGWKGRSGTAIAVSDNLIAFYSSVLTGLKKLGVLEWHFLKCREADLAGHMAFRFRNKVILWKLAYNETYSACSPGSLLMRELVKREIDAETRTEIDLTTDQIWYKNWNLVGRSYYQIFFYNKLYWLSSVYRLTHEIYAGIKKNPAIQSMRNAFKSIFRRHANT